ncbi:MAG: phosphatidate cytidylyltransferase [Acholeplasmatales bacterium]|jgi:phosphatidate cytidylyltransferase|nr:phosphatidate cytidylyltransferase [Acholeplasmatales bacterium]
MKKRVITAAILVSLITCLIAFPVLERAFIAFITVLMIIACFEMFHMFAQKNPLTKYSRIVTIACVLILFFSAGGVFFIGIIGVDHGLDTLSKIRQVDSLLMTSIVIVIAIFTMQIFVKDFSSEDTGKIISTVFYLGIGFSSIINLKLLGTRFIIYALIITSLTDCFAMFGGMLFGKHKLCPEISPNKTVEGAIIGTVIASIIAVLYALFYGYIFVPGTDVGNIFNASGAMTLLGQFSDIGSSPLYIQALVIVPITLFASIFGQIGDLVASKFKRDYNLKDFSKIFPGHGGVLDRFDSLLFVSMVLIFFFTIINRIIPLLPPLEEFAIGLRFLI